MLVAVAAYFYNSGGDVGSQSTPSGAAASTAASPGASAAVHLRQRRRVQHSSDHNTLRMEEVTVEAARGDIDPTLRLDLLQRLKTVKFTAGNRNLFAAGAVITPQMAAAKPVRIMPGPLPRPGINPVTGQPIAHAPPPIPLKFYGFAAPASANGLRRGFFLDQDNVVVADEGETVKGRYRIVTLQPKSAEVEDLVTKNRQSLAIVPETAPSGF